ncbi:MAG: AEC family transporter [Pseudomonadota bacterium]
MIALLDVVLPVAMVIFAGFLAVRTGYVPDRHLDALMSFAQQVAIPCLLFRATMTLDFGAVFDPRLLISFYTGATISFFLGILGARLIFKRRPGEAVAIGFGALFSNSVIFGLPIVERAFGADALAATFAIIAIHAPFCYFLGITVMEISRADGRGFLGTARAVLNGMLRNALMIGIALGFLVNFSGQTLPDTALSALDMIVSAALPTALFAVGGVLTRYRLTANLGEVAMVAGLSLILHPAIAYTLSAGVFRLQPAFVEAATLTAAMAPGVNTYVFAALYNRGEALAAATVLVATCVSLATVSIWLSLLA